jgi:hypothetical protein
MLSEQSRWLDTHVKPETHHPNPNRRPIAIHIIAASNRIKDLRTKDFLFTDTL